MKAEEIAKFAENKYIQRLNEFKTNDFKDGVFEGYNLALTQKQNDIDELVSSNEKLLKIAKHYIKNHDYVDIVESELLIQKHTKK